MDTCPVWGRYPTLGQGHASETWCWDVVSQADKERKAVLALGTE